MTENQLLERLASIEHDQWADWATSLLNQDAVTFEKRDRWRYLISKHYDDLSEEEKEQDRKYARQALEVVVDYITDRISTMNDDEIVELICHFEALRIENDREQGRKTASGV